MAGLLACTGTSPEVDVPTPSPLSLTPYLTSTPTTPSQTDDTTDQEAQTSDELVDPTVTPFLYSIQSGDTLSVVAFRHGVSLEDLLAANPGVDPNLLIVGTEVIIPTGDGQILGLPTPTPVAVDIGKPVCYATSDAGTWCLVMVTNQQVQAVENISVMVRLNTIDGGTFSQQIAISPLNILPQGESIVLAAHFSKVLQIDDFSDAELLTSIPVADDNQRYIDPLIVVQNVLLEESTAQIQGMVTIQTDNNTQSVNLVWLGAMAFDESGKPVGLRKFEHSGEIQPGESLDFDFSVYSNGPPIAVVYILGEARP